VAIEVSYARRGDISIAYQVLGSGPVDIIFGAGMASHLDLMWADPRATEFLRGLGGFGRLILFDKPGTGLSDPVVGIPTVEQRVGDFLAVLDAAESRRALVVGFSEAETPAILLAATHPERVEALVLISGGARLTTAPDFVPEEEPYVEGVVWKQFRHSQQHWGDGSFLLALSPFMRRSAVYRRLAPSLERAGASPGMARVLIESMRSYDVTPALEFVNVPALVMHRSEEWVPVGFGRRTAEGIAGSRYLELPGDEHMVFFAGEEVLDAIGRFIAGDRVKHKSPTRRLITLLFTDIVGSTSLAAQLGDKRWCALLAQHDQMLADEVERHDGTVVKSLGDGALATFDRPTMAVQCAIRLRERMVDLGLEVTAGLHIGECEVVADGADLGGLAVHIAARIAQQASPNEILVSSTLRDLLMGSGLELMSRGSRSLKNVDGSWHLFAVGTATAFAQRHPQSATPEEAALTPAPRDAMKPFDRAMVRIAQVAPRLSRTGIRAVTRAPRRRAR
jgi:class 3 adenylate cyclase/pimeloyl-ACP methyl ester carboxylesterase